MLLEIKSDAQVFYFDTYQISLVAMVHGVLTVYTTVGNFKFGDAGDTTTAPFAPSIYPLSAAQCTAVLEDWIDWLTAPES